MPDTGFLIDDDTTYQDIADYLYSDDPSGVSDLIYILLEKNPSLKDEILSWTS